MKSLGRTPFWVRPFAEFGTLAYRKLLLLPFWPFTRFAQSEIIECFPVYFKDERKCKLMLRLGLVKPGAVWDAHWLHDCRTGEDGQSLFVLTPIGPWFIDDIASNCTKPHDHDHRCWVRTGSVEEGTLHVAKNGNTCEAGAGSIRHGGYHARLVRNNLIRIVFF